MNTEILRQCYAAFNARSTSRALLPRCTLRCIGQTGGKEAGWRVGRASAATGNVSGQRSIRPRSLKDFRLEPDGRITVSVHQIVRDLTGKVLADEMVEHVYQVQDGLVRQMDIRR